MLNLEGLGHLPILSVPVEYGLIIRRREEMLPIIGEAEVLDRLRVTNISTEALPISTHVPELHLMVHSPREEKMTELGEEADYLHSLRMAVEGMDTSFRDVTGVVRVL
jgi:hypothetical protein